MMSDTESGAGDPDVNWNRRILNLAGPIILANLSVPLLGLVDTLVMGHQPDPNGLGAVALGAVIFSTVFFTFGFLRMSTTALAAQADGAADPREVRAVLYRAGGIALVIAGVLVLLHGPIGAGAFALVDAEIQVERLSLTYFQIRIWSAPAALLNLALLGWLFGLGRMRLPVTVQIVTNIINIALDFLFVFGLDWGVEGVAGATLIAEWGGMFLAVFVIIRQLRAEGGLHVPRPTLFDMTRIRRLFAVNRDIMIRTFCLIFAFAHFKATGAGFGTLTLAANAVLLTFLDICSHGLDAFANAAEILIGKAVGAKNRQTFRKVVRLVLLWSGGLATAISLLFLMFGGQFVALLTTQEPVRDEAAVYIAWAALLPITAVWCFALDGIFIGATRSAALRNGMIAATAIYFTSQWVLVDAYANHGLWAALHIFLLARALTLAVQYPSLARSIGER